MGDRVRAYWFDLGLKRLEKGDPDFLEKMLHRRWAPHWHSVTTASGTWAWLPFADGGGRLLTPPHAAETAIRGIDLPPELVALIVDGCGESSHGD